MQQVSENKIEMAAGVNAAEVKAPAPGLDVLDEDIATDTVARSPAAAPGSRADVQATAGLEVSTMTAAKAAEATRAQARKNLVELSTQRSLSSKGHSAFPRHCIVHSITDYILLFPGGYQAL